MSELDPPRDQTPSSQQQLQSAGEQINTADVQLENAAQSDTASGPAQRAGEQSHTESFPHTESSPHNGDVPEKTARQSAESAEDDEETAMSLPLSKIKRILKMDPEYFGSSATAVYAAGTATELFVQYLVEQASLNAKVEKRKKIQYKDFSSAVSSQEALYFLSDTIPKTQIVREALKQKKINLTDDDRNKYETPAENPEVTDNLDATGRQELQAPVVATLLLPRGQSTLPFSASNKINKAGILNLMDNDAMQID